MKLSEAIRLAGGPKPDVYLDRILVSRTNDDSTRLQLRSAFKDSTGTVVERSGAAGGRRDPGILPLHLPAHPVCHRGRRGAEAGAGSLPRRDDDA